MVGKIKNGGCSKTRPNSENLACKKLDLIVIISHKSCIRNGQCGVKNDK